MTIDELIKIARKHKYDEISCVIDGEIVKVKQWLTGTEFTCSFDKLDLSAKNVSTIAAIRDHNVLLQLLNVDEHDYENDENNAYEAMSCYGFMDKLMVQSDFPDYPYNDEYLYSIIDDSFIMEWEEEYKYIDES